MWLAIGFFSALLLGFYDLAKKISLRDNAVLPVLFLNTVFCSLIFLPFVIGSFCGKITVGMAVFVPFGGLGSQPWILIKSFIVLSSWILGYYGIKYIPLTIVGPINATRPIMALVGALVVFGERLNLMQWLGVLTAIISFFLLSRTGKKEGVDFRHNKWLLCVVMAAVLGAISSLYDKFLLARSDNGGLGLNRMEVIAWYNLYQCVWMALLTAFLWWRRRKESAPFKWRWSIILISLFLLGADLAYFTALGFPGAMVSLLSMVRRSNVLVSFTFGVLLLGEKHWKGKALDLLLVIVGMLLIWLGTD